MKRKTNRRELLKNSALATAGAGSGALLGGSEPAEAQGSAARAPQRTVDVVVIGAGFGGMAAAYEARKRGRSVVVLEAGPRVGGRTWTAKLSDGTAFEIGGQWITGTETQAAILDLITELNARGANIQLFRQYERGATILVNEDGVAFPWDQTSEEPPPISEEGIIDLAQATVKLTQMASVVDPLAPWTPVDFPQEPFELVGPAGTLIENNLQADRMSLDTFVELNMNQPPLPQDGRLLLSAGMAGVNASELAAVSLLHMVALIASTGSVDGLPPNFTNLTGAAVGQAEAFRIKGGTGRIMGAMWQSVGGAQNVITSSPVSEIAWNSSGVTVTSDRMVVRAKRAIVAVPTALMNFIRFVPALPANRAMVQQRVPQGTVYKIWLAYDRAWWREVSTKIVPEGFSGEQTSIKPGDFVVNTRDAGDPDVQSPGLLNCFVAADAARQFQTMTRAQRKARVIEEMVARFGAFGFGEEAASLSTRFTFPAVPPQNPQRDNYFEFNWAIDEWARGDFSLVPGPGVYSAEGFGPAIREPVGPIFWGCVDQSTDFYASISGAATPGKRAVLQALGLL